MGYTVPVELYSASDKSTFAYESTVKRWPRILTGIIDDLNKNFDTCEGEKLSEAKKLISNIAVLKYEIAHDRALQPLEEDGGANIADYNEELAKMAENGVKTWFQMPWLFAECFMYRRIRALFAHTQYWQEYDPFAKQKIETFASAAPGVFALALSVNNLIESHSKAAEQDSLQAEFLELAQVALWGNATDLSLLQNLSHADIQALQKTGKAAQKEAEHLILANDLDKAWQHLKTLEKSRIDIVLDNAGFELYGDLLLADWLLSTPFCDEIVFHPKDIPWFVSDVLPGDFEATFEALANPSSFFNTEGNRKVFDEEHIGAIEKCLSRWREHFSTGRFKISLPQTASLTEVGKASASSPSAYWTNPLSYAFIPEKSPELLRELQKASLVIFKGDLNYRKLTSDAKWPSTTLFTEALGPLAGAISLLTLRTLKADVCVGLAPGTAERLDAEDPSWRVSGKYAVIGFSGRTQ